MVIDKEEHRKMLLELLSQSTFPGTAIDKVYELKQAVIGAKFFDSTQSNENSVRGGVGSIG